MAGSEIAHELGLICSFMPKVDSHRTGNGMHFHVSMSDAKSENIFQDDTDSRGMGLSEVGYHFLGGILHHAKALCALGAPTVNSYKRLVIGDALSGATWAPAYISYGDNNRSALVRIPYGRLELRLADGGCNPYLVTAGLIAAGLDGVDNKRNPGDPLNINHYTSDLSATDVDILPQNLDRALDALEEDNLFSDTLGQGIVEEFIRIKRMEWTEYMRHVSDWEVDRYLEYF
jgi:glutamine synthetase